MSYRTSLYRRKYLKSALKCPESVSQRPETAALVPWNRLVWALRRSYGALDKCSKRR